MAHHNPSSSMHALTRLLTSLPQSPTSSSSTRLLSLYPRSRRPLPLTVPSFSRWLQTQSHSPSSSRSRIPEPDVPLVFPTQGSGAGINNRPENPCLNHEVAGTGKAKALMGEQDFGLGAWGDKLKSSGKGKEILDGPSDEELNARALKQLGVESSASVTSSLSSPTSSSSSSSIEIDQTSLPPAKRSHIPPPNVSGKKDVLAKRTARTIGLKPKKNAITLTSTAVSRLKELAHPEPSSSGPAEPDASQLLRISVKNRGCAGLSYHLSYLPPTQISKFDEIVEQDGVRVLVDSRALFSVVGSEMDWVEDRLSSRFVFNNPNVKDACGCGESFHV